MSMRWHYIYIAFIYMYVCMKNNKYILNIDTATNWTYSHFQNQIKEKQYREKQWVSLVKHSIAGSFDSCPGWAFGMPRTLSSCGVNIFFNESVLKVTSGCRLATLYAMCNTDWAQAQRETRETRLVACNGMRNRQGREASLTAGVKRKRSNGQHMAGRS